MATAVRKVHSRIGAYESAYALPEWPVCTAIGGRAREVVVAVDAADARRIGTAGRRDGETAGDKAARRPWRAEWRRGFVAIMPLWIGVVPFGVTYGVIARQAGFGGWETQASSLLIFAGSAQMAMISLFDRGAAPLAIVLTALVLNLRHVLYGLSLVRELGSEPARPRPAFLAPFLTDESYGMTVADGNSAVPGRRADAFLFGASVSLYLVYALATLAGVSLGGVLPDADDLGLELVFPLSFLVLLLPLVRGSRSLLVAVLSAIAVLAAGRVFDGGVAILLATLGAAGSGALLDRRSQPQ